MAHSNIKKHDQGIIAWWKFNTRLQNAVWNEINLNLTNLHYKGLSNIATS